MNELLKKFLEYMMDDYLELCETEYVEDSEFPFTSEELEVVRSELNKIVGRDNNEG
jgi:hypothetical protein